MRFLTLGLAAAFAIGLTLSAVPALAEGDCGWGHKTKTASTSSPNIAQGQTKQTPKPDQGG